MELFGTDGVKPETKEGKEKAPEQKFELKLEGQDLKRTLISGEVTDHRLKVTNNGTKDDTVVLRVNIIYSTEKSDEAPEWSVRIKGLTGEIWDVTTTKETEKEFVLESGGSKSPVVEVTAPKGARYGDVMNLMLTIFSKKDPGATETLTISSTARQTIKAVKTSIGHEMVVADSIYSKAKTKDVGIFSIFSPANVRGYIFVETMNPDRLEEIVRMVRKAKGVVEGDTKISEIYHFLTPKPVVSGVMEGDIVELIAGPFKGEKARVQHIDRNKEEITVELFESVVPIPITVRGDSVRILKKEKE